MKEKGFTLVELIVVIAIMGILLIVVFPSVSQVQQENKFKKFASYGQSMVASSKLYVDQYYEDLWGVGTGTRTIALTELLNRNLITAFPSKGDTCSSGNVTVSRSGSKDQYNYTYHFQVSCKLGSNIVTCDGDDKTSQCMMNGKKVYSTADE